MDATGQVIHVRIPRAFLGLVRSAWTLGCARLCAQKDGPGVPGMPLPVRARVSVLSGVWAGLWMWGWLPPHVSAWLQWPRVATSMRPISTCAQRCSRNYCSLVFACVDLSGLGFGCVREAAAV